MILQKLRILTAIIVPAILIAVTSCQKEEETDTGTDIRLSFSADTVIFDTVFTTIGSTTRILQVYNNNQKKIKISEIRLAGGDNSPFTVNIDGNPSTVVRDVEIEGKDSLFIFIRITVDPSNQNNPFIISDSIIFQINGNLTDVDLVAWGQDANFIVGNNKLEGFRFPYAIVAGENETVVWSNARPYVIYGYAIVDSSGTLNITEGASIHFHKNSGLWIYRGGAIHVEGTFENPVIFQGDRLEATYDELPGQWDRIWINEGGSNTFKHTVIKNGFIGIQAETLKPDGAFPGDLTLENCIIKNMSQWALFTLSYQVTAGNCLFANCGENVVYLTTGGMYDFRHCTFANYWNHSIRQSPLFVLTNYIIVQDANGYPVTLLGNLHKAFFGNCLIYGNLEDEFLLSGDGSVAFNYAFDHSGIRSYTDYSSDPYFTACTFNEDPMFSDSYKHDFTLDTLSPVIDKGSMEVISSSVIPLQLDLLNNDRTNDSGPDLGAYEFKPE
ncbi:MAG: hypothetical protein JXA03_11705 [Bacteroidales bacterium]|nr:hypothetical protein [Bacteroidales bacterium]